MNSPLYYILRKLLEENTINFDEKELEFQLQSHPSYPSLHSLTGVLSHFNIQNLALEVPSNKDIIKQLPPTFIAYVKDEEKDDLVLVKKTSDRIKLVYDHKYEAVITISDFLKIWTGIMVAVEKDDNILTEPKPKKESLTKGLGVLTIVVLVTLFLSMSPTMFSGLHFLLSFIGLGISVVIVKHELGFKSKVADKFCSGNIDKVDCNEVLNSKAASFLGYFKLSDIGIVYFMSMVVAWLLISLSQANNHLLILITLLAVPFTFYSIFYQYFRIKKWCLLCLSIVSVLWLQAGSLYFVNFQSIEPGLNIENVMLVIFSYLFSISLWSFLLPKLKKEQELNKLKIEYYKFKRDYSLFKSLLDRSEPIKTSINGLEEIKLGSNAPALQIVIITNPLCSHCREVHKLIETLLEKENKELQIIIRFNVSAEQNSVDTKIASRLLEIYSMQGKSKCLSALHDIYGEMHPESWLRKWKETNEKEYIDILRNEREWCQNNKINFTPVILLNGKTYPNEYKRSDLHFFIDDMVEEHNEIHWTEVTV